VFYHRLTQEFETRPADQTRPFPRALRAAARAASLLDNPRIGGFAALGAIVVGGLMMAANIERGDVQAPVAEAQNAAPVAPVAPVARVAVAPAPSPSVVAVAPASPVALAPPQADKTTIRVDTTTTGAIAQDGPAKPKHKTHPKKAKLVDNSQ
jgi:hypothetical protein